MMFNKLSRMLAVVAATVQMPRLRWAASAPPNPMLSSGMRPPRRILDGFGEYMLAKPNFRPE